MGIFNSEFELRIEDIYDIEKSLKNNYALVGWSNFFECCHPNPKKYPEYTHFNELYDLCSVSQPDYTFYEVKSDKSTSPIPAGAFVERTIEGLFQCSIGGLDVLNKQIQEKCRVKGARVDIIHDFEQSVTKGQPISYEYMSNQFGLSRTKILLKFPTYFKGLQSLEAKHTWTMMYTHKNDAPKRFWCVCFPLIPKDGCKDVFFAI